MTTRQFEHLQASSLRELQALVPHDCPLVVRRLQRPGAQGGFAVNVLDQPLVGLSGRMQVVAAWIAGYVTAWRAKP